MERSEEIVVGQADYKTAEVAKLAGVHIKTVQKWLAEGTLPGAYRIGGGKGAWRVRRDVLDALMGRDQP